jgi:ABC-type Na+ efflux pump permease subunit
VSHHVADTLTLLRRELLRYRRERAYWVGQILFPLAFVASSPSSASASTT